jgi:predicted nucleotidyltransferase
MNKFGLTNEQIELIVSVFISEKCIKKAVIFGSRSLGTFKPYSDIDIALFGELSSSDAEHIKLILEELPIIYSFDVLAYGDIQNPALLEHVKQYGKVLFERE